MRRLARQVLAIEDDAACVGQDLAAQLVDQRGLAGAVGADHRMQLAAGQVQVHMVGGQQAAESLDEAADFEMVHGFFTTSQP